MTLVETAKLHGLDPAKSLPEARSSGRTPNPQALTVGTSSLNTKPLVRLVLRRNLVT
jgi:hypothetical protein